MLIKKIETTFIPQSLEGQKYAEAFVNGLKEINAFRGCKEDTVNIIVTAEYYFNLNENNKEGMCSNCSYKTDTCQEGLHCPKENEYG